jgi:cyclophilin family peptidyl-prolyl cis-trans isomerase
MKKFILGAPMWAPVCVLLCALCPAAFALPSVEVKTNLGSFEIELYPEKAPATVANFLAYVREGFYEKVLFHRLVPNVLLQAGFYDSSWRMKTAHGPIPSEAANGLSNAQWSVAMGHGRSPDSATSEFFINIADNADFDYGRDGTSAYYCVFGKVTSGLDTIKKMLEPGIISGGDFVGDQPARPLVIEHIKLLNGN